MEGLDELPSELGLDRCRKLPPPVSRGLGERLKERQSGDTGRSNGWLSAQNQSSDDDKVMIVQVFLVCLAFSIQQQQVKKAEGWGGSCLVDQVKHLVYNIGPE